MMREIEPLAPVDCEQLAAAVGPASLLAGMDVVLFTDSLPPMPQQAACITAAASCQSTVGSGQLVAALDVRRCA